MSSSSIYSFHALVLLLIFVLLAASDFQDHRAGGSGIIMMMMMGTVDAAAAAAWTTTSSRHSSMRRHSFPHHTLSKNHIVAPLIIIQKRVATATALLSVVSSGADIELSGQVEESSLSPVSSLEKASSAGATAATAGEAALPILTRGKVNEIDFTIAPADVSLSRAYGTTQSTSSTTTTKTVANDDDDDDGESSSSPPPPPILLSLTRALNNASNRAIRRIMLARSWPSAKALNLSLRRVAELERQAAAQAQTQTSAVTTSMEEKTTTTMMMMDPNAPKCPVPRPILNVLMRKREQVSAASSASTSSSQPPIPRKAAVRTDDEYVADQLQSFQKIYGNLPGYAYAEAYLESVLSLATSGIESPRVQQVMTSAIYDESYKRILGVLNSVGVVFEPYNDDNNNGNDDDATGQQQQRRCIAKKLQDQDICLSILDKIRISKEKQQQQGVNNIQQGTVTADPLLLVKLNKVDKETDEKESNVLLPPPKTVKDNVDDTNSKVASEPSSPPPTAETTKRPKIEIQVEDGVSILKPKFNLFGKGTTTATSTTTTMTTTASISANADEILTGEDLGGVLLSAQEPSMTAQLNVLANIVQRALLFGGDEELLVLSETLQADRAAFCERWYPNSSTAVTTTTATADADSSSSSQTATELSVIMNEQRPGVQFINCLIQLLRTCYQQGVVTDLTPPLPLSTSFANAYERLVCAAVELGSGYLKPTPDFMTMTNNNGPTSMTATLSQISTLPKPRNAQEELGRFAVWETNFRRAASGNKDAASTTTPDDVLKSSAYPSDLEGTWQVLDEIGSETIGQSTVVFKPKGNVQVPPPLEGLRWRLDPGPTHLDTCTFQVLSSDGTILQYRGFLDRGARLEARFSKRPLRIRGSVMFQMRDGSIDYYKDMLPINYKQGTTKFVMTKVGSSSSSSSSSADSSSGITTYKMIYGTR